MAEFANRQIKSVTIVTESPARLPGLASRLSGIHVTTRAGVIRRDLLFAAGSRIDTARVAESLRRLRHRQYLADAQVAGISCAGDEPVDLVVTTRDRWTTKPSLTVQSNSSLAGIEEDDLFGSGTSGSLSFALREGKAGVAAGYESFWLFGQALAAKFRASVYPDGHDVRGRFRNQQHSVYDKWFSELIVSSYVRDTKETPNRDFQSFHRETALGLIGRSINETPTHVDQLLLGVDVAYASSANL